MKFTFLALFLALTLTACLGSEPEISVLDKPFPELEQTARTTEVRWHMWGGSSQINQWVDSYVIPEMKKRYDITVVRVPMDASVFVNKLLNEKTADKKKGTMDLLWINGENFKNAMEAGVLFGPFSEKLPNYTALYDSSQSDSDFGYPVRGFEAPYGKAQFVFEYNSDRVLAPPANFDALKEWIKAHPGRFTYPEPPDFTGSAFLRHVFYATTGGYTQYMNGVDKNLYAKNIQATWDWLNEVKPFLWQEGKTYPKDSAALDTLFARGEIDMGMSYHPGHAHMKILEKTYPETVRTFVMEEGAIFNTHFVAIPFNAPNKAGAMVLANFLLSAEAQLSKYVPASWGDMPALDLTRLTDEARQAFEAVDFGDATLPPDMLLRAAVPEIPAGYLEMLEKDWDKHILGH